MLRLTYDADGAGRQCGKAIIANDEKALHNISAKIDLGHELVNEWVAAHGGKRISGGGDEGSFKLPEKFAEKIEELREKYFQFTGLTISVGIGQNLSEAGRSLLYAKATGKDKIIKYSYKVEEGIEKVKEKVKKGIATQEESKLADAYLEKSWSMSKLCNLHKKELHKTHLIKHEEGFHQSAATEDDVCPYCADQEDNRTDDCAYCQDLDAEENADGTAGMHDCDACKEYDAAQQETGGIDDCPYCQTENIAEVQAHPEQDVDHICNCPNCPKHDATALGVEDMGAEHPDDCPECQEMYGDAVEEQPSQTGQEDPNLQGHETAEEVLDLLDQEPGTGELTPSQEAKKIDNTELPQGDAMDENTSVKENFGDTQKGDISDSEKKLDQNHSCNCPDCASNNQSKELGQEQPESGQQSGQMEELGQEDPDMSDVLQSGLDDHANNQKKQQVLDMVGQTLAGFKANKASLESTKEQNQPLYNSCIQMLKSMIELCKLLGLEPKMPDSPEQAQPMPQDGQATPSAVSPSSEESPADPKAVG